MSHWYNTDGILQPEGIGLPSATTILSVRHNQGLQDWRDRMGAQAADEYKAERAGIGTYVHGAIEALLNKEIVLIDGEYKGGDEYTRPYVQGFVNWLDKQETIASMLPERFVYSEEYGYAGTADLICFIGDDQWILDWKTSKHIDPAYGLQLAAYAYAWEEMGHGKVRRGVLQLTDQTKKGWRFKEFTDPEDFDVFLAHKRIFDWQLKTSKRKQTPQWEIPIIAAV